MNFKYKTLLAILTTFATVGLASAVNAQQVRTVPVGGVSYSFVPGSQIVGISMVKPQITGGRVASVSGATTLTVIGSPAVGSLLTASVPYYVEIVRDASDSVSDTGDRFDLDTAATIAAPAGTIVLRATSENTISGPLPSSLVNSQFVIRRHFTLGGLATDLPGAFLVGDRISIRRDGSTIVTVTLNSGGNWVAGAQNNNNTVIYPGVGFFLVRSSATTTSATLLGSVRANTFVQVLRSGNQVLCEGFPVPSAPNPTAVGAASRLFTNSNGTTFASSDRLTAYNPSGVLTTYSYNTTLNRWVAGATNGNLLNLFSPTRGFFLNASGANDLYVQTMPFNLNN